MKTTKTTKTFSKEKKIALYVALVTVLGFLSYLVPQAHYYDSRYRNADKDFFKLINEEEPEALLEVQNWMLDFQTEDSANVIQERVKQLNAPESKLCP